MREVADEIAFKIYSLGVFYGHFIPDTDLQRFYTLAVGCVPYGNLFCFTYVDNNGFFFFNFHIIGAFSYERGVP